MDRQDVKTTKQLVYIVAIHLSEQNIPERRVQIKLHHNIRSQRNIKITGSPQQYCVISQKLSAMQQQSQQYHHVLLHLVAFLLHHAQSQLQTQEML